MQRLSEKKRMFFPLFRWKLMEERKSRDLCNDISLILAKAGK